MKRITFLSLVCILISIFSFSTFAQFDMPKKPEKPPETAEEWCEYARWITIYERDDKKAMEAVNKAIELSPTYTDAFHLRGVIKKQHGDYKGALEDFNTVIQYEPNVTSTYMLRAETRMQINKDLDGALNDYDLLITNLRAKNTRIYNASFGRGVLRYMKGDYDGAIADFTDAQKMNISVSCQFYRGLAWLKKGNLTQALEDIKAVVDYNKMVTEEARRKYPELHKENSDYPYNQNPLASLKPKNNRANIEGTAIAIDVSPATGGIVSKIKWKTIDEKLVVDNWFDFLNMNRFDVINGDDESVFYFFYGQLLEESGDIDEAEEAYTTSIISQNKNHAAHFSRGKIRLKAGNFEQAVRDFSWTISINPNNAEAWLERGVSLLLMGHDALAQKDFDIYSALAPDKKVELTKCIAAAKKQRDEMKKKQDQK